ncbi:microsomal epoxide hydrolase [Lasallia pustulata]|uniref:Microsomal epoxide hydrolase n=1 Tax=Lasallia pustulata TaxID=136370 RepID=A0A1W5D731_9LECA|nr:microsomal epoxide hydrolase [Lasallia pustulata]
MIPAPAPSLTTTPLLALQHALTPYTRAEKAGLTRSTWFEKGGSHYGFLQASKPQTMGYALADSPVALLAWIYEKLRDWTDGYPCTEEEVLTWVSLYLFSTGWAAASLRIYYQALHEEGDGSRKAATGWLPGTRLGLAWFPRDIHVVPRVWGRGLGDVVFERERESGGHCAAWERPEWVVQDLKEVFGKARGAFWVVSGRSGFD